MMYTGTSPFELADIHDPFYQLLALNRQADFFVAHEQGQSKPGLFSPEFKDLISGLLAFQPYMRPAMAEVVGHPFFTDGGEEYSAA